MRALINAVCAGQLPSLLGTQPLAKISELNNSNISSSVPAGRIRVRPQPTFLSEILRQGSNTAKVPLPPLARSQASFLSATSSGDSVIAHAGTALKNQLIGEPANSPYRSAAQQLTPEQADVIFRNFFHLSADAPIRIFTSGTQVFGHYDFSDGVIFVGPNYEVAYVPSSQALAELPAPDPETGSYDLNKVIFGRPAKITDMQFSILRFNDKRIEQSIREMIEGLYQPTTEHDPVLPIQVGFEDESTVTDPLTGKTVQINGNEALKGTFEEATDPFRTFVAAARGLAQRRKDTLEMIHKDHPGVLLVSTGTHATGTVDDNNFNIHAPYNAVFCARWENIFGGYRIHTPEAQMLHEEQARRARVSLRELINAKGCTLWDAQAGHASISNPGYGYLDEDKLMYVADGEMMLGEMALLAAWAAFPRVSSVSGCFTTNILVKTPEDKAVLDTRSPIRNALNRAGAATQPILTPEDWIQVLAQNLTKGPSSPLQMDRGSFPVAAGEFGEHADGRARISSSPAPVNRDAKGLDGAPFNANSGRVEDTSITSTEIFAKIRIMAYQVIRNFLTAEARINHANPFEWTAQRYLRGDVAATSLWFDAGALDTEFNRHRSNSPHLQNFLSVLERIAENITAPKLQLAKNILIHGCQTVLETDVTFNHLAHNHGTQGAAAVNLVEAEGMNALQTIHVIAAFQDQQMNWLLEASDEEIISALLGNGGFKFRRPTDLDQYTDNAITARLEHESRKVIKIRGTLETKAG